MLKYEIGQKVWFIKNDKIQNKQIIAKRYYQNDNNEEEKTYVVKDLDICDRVIKEGEAFLTKKELLDYLDKSAEE